METGGLHASSLELEVTESVFAEDLDAVCRILDEARNLGVRIALDDFGAGYSSLHHLNRLPLDLVKIDGVFARDFAAGGEAIIAAAVSIAHKLGIESIVEGIENSSMLASVRALGASKIQGYLYARPMPLNELSAWIAEFAAQSGADSAKKDGTVDS